MNLNITVLYVDDDRINLLGFKALFRMDFNILTTPKPEEAIKLLEENKIDVIIADQLMPVMTGVQLLQLVKNKHPEISRFLLTGYFDDKEVEEARSLNIIEEYFMKPLDEIKIKNKIMELSKAS